MNRDALHAELSQVRSSLRGISPKLELAEKLRTREKEIEEILYD